jgi:hypothetical protein
MLAPAGDLDAAPTEPSDTGGCCNAIHADRGGSLVRVVGSVEINRPASQVGAYVADYGNDPGWRAGVSEMRPSLPGPAPLGVTTHELLRLGA